MNLPNSRSDHPPLAESVPDKDPGSESVNREVKAPRQLPSTISCALPSGRFSVLAQTRDGHFYPGDILRDTINYRGLRAASMHNPLSDACATRLAKLEERLRQGSIVESASELDANEVALRAFQRYNCAYLGVLRYNSQKNPDTVMCQPVWVSDISAGGVKISGMHQFEPGLPAVLHIRNTGPDCVEFQLPSRIAWARADAYGLMFAGPPVLIRDEDPEELAA